MRYLETARGVSNAEMVTPMREIHVDDVSRTHTHTQKYSDFLVYTISVGLAQARPNYVYGTNYMQSCVHKI